MKVYNSHALSRNQRFANALIAGVIASIGCGIVLGYVLRLVNIVFNIMYLAVGYGVGYAIRSYGRGVQKQFSILGAVLTAVGLLIADVVSSFGLLGLFKWPCYYVCVLTTLGGLNNIWGILNILFIVGAIIVGYEQSRIV